MTKDTTSLKVCACERVLSVVSAGVAHIANIVGWLRPSNPPFASDPSNLAQPDYSFTECREKSGQGHFQKWQS